MTVTLEVGIGNLLPEFLADTLVLLASLQTAGTIATGPLQTVFYHLNHFLIFVKTYCHGGTSLLDFEK